MSVSSYSTERLGLSRPSYRPLDILQRNDTDFKNRFETGINTPSTGVTAIRVNGSPIIQPLSSSAILQLQQYEDTKDDGLGVPFQIDEADTEGSATLTQDAVGNSNQDHELLREITENGFKGYIAWKVRELRKQVSEEVFAQHGVTQESYSKLSPDKQKAIQEIIETEVKRRLAELLDTPEPKKFQQVQQTIPAPDAAASSRSAPWTAARVSKPPTTSISI